MFVQKLTKHVKIGYSISLFFGVLTVISGYIAFKKYGDFGQLAFGLFTLGLVLTFICLTVLGNRKWRHQTQGKGKYRIKLPSPARLYNTPWLVRYGRVIGYVVRIAMSCGFVPVLIGKAGSGKTLILESATPGQVFGNALNEKAMPNSTPVWTIPEGGFSIEELTHYPSNYMSELLINISDRKFALSAQSTDSLTNIGLDTALRNRRKLFIFLE